MGTEGAFPLRPRGLTRIGKPPALNAGQEAAAPPPAVPLAPAAGVARRRDENASGCSDLLTMTQAQNPPLMAATRAYVETAVRWLASRQGLGEPLLRPYERWTRLGERTYVRQHGTSTDWVGLLTNREALHQLPEYGAAVGLLETDPVLAPQLDRLVGTTASGYMRLQKDQLLDRIAALSVHNRPLVFEEEAFTEAYVAVETELYATTIASVVVAPLAGVAGAPKTMLGAVELDRLTDDEAQILLGAGFLQWMSDHHVAWTTTEHVLRLRCELPKEVGHDPAAAVNGPHVSPVLDPRDDFLRILSGLRLLKADPVALPGFVRVSEPCGARMISSAPLAPMPTIRVPTYVLNEQDAAELVTVWTQLQDPRVQERTYIGNAIRRFGSAGERDRIEDRFVDLMIAAEAMFLGERRKGETAGELTYKLSMRFAHFATVPGTTRRERYEHMKRAYGARSGIVHGEPPKGLRKAEDLASFTARTADYLRWALRKMIVEAQDHPERRMLIDWDELILGGRT